MQLLLCSHEGYFVIATLFRFGYLSRPTSAAKAQCMPGHFLNRTSDECDPCPDGTFAGQYNRDEHCPECTRCTGMLVVAATCNASSDTRCVCPDGYFTNSDGGCTVRGLEPNQSDESRQSLLRIETKVDNASKALHDLEKSVGLLETLAGTNSVQPTIVLLSVLLALLLLILVVLAVVFRQKLTSQRCTCWSKPDSGNQKTSVQKTQVHRETANQTASQVASKPVASKPASQPGNQSENTMAERTAADLQVAAHFRAKPQGSPNVQLLNSSFSSDRSMDTSQTLPCGGAANDVTRTLSTMPSDDQNEDIEKANAQSGEEFVTAQDSTEMNISFVANGNNRKT